MKFIQEFAVAKEYDRRSVEEAIERRYNVERFFFAGCDDMTLTLSEEDAETFAFVLGVDQEEAELPETWEEMADTLLQSVIGYSPKRAILVDEGDSILVLA